MNCKGSPYSQASTGLENSPVSKMKFSRKFVINLEDLPETSTDCTETLSKVNKKILRYKRKYRAKKVQFKEDSSRNNEFKQEIDFENNQLSELYKELEAEYEKSEKLIVEDKELSKDLEKIQEVMESEMRSTAKLAKLEPSEIPTSFNLGALEEMQEMLFASNAKATELERKLSKDQKKNDNLTKELRILKMEFSSKQM